MTFKIQNIEILLMSKVIKFKINDQSEYDKLNKILDYLGAEGFLTKGNQYLCLVSKKEKNRY